MNKIIKKLKRSIISLINYISLINFKPYKLLSILFPGSSYSDFFVYDTNCYRNFYITENLYGLLKGRKIEVKHFFKFFNPKGFLIKEFEIKTNRLTANIKLPKIESEARYLSFTHEIKIKKEFIDKDFEKIILNSRGYTKYIYRKNSLGSLAHGNFGAINHKRLGAIQRKHTFCYTPVYTFNSKNIYHLVFNNPTDRNLNIKIVSFNKKQELISRGTLNLNKFGTDFIEIKNLNTNISFLSNLPICRCVVFKNPFKNELNLDVFHS